MSDLQQLGRGITAIRLLRSMRPAQMAEMLGMLPGDYLKIEIGDPGSVAIERLEEIARILNVTTETLWVMGEEPDPATPNLLSSVVQDLVKQAIADQERGGYELLD